MARSGAVGHNGSGDIFLAFSTANEAAATSRIGATALEALANAEMDPLFEATVEATDEAILELFPQKEALHRWIRKAQEKVRFQGLPQRVRGVCEIHHHSDTFVCCY